MSRGACTIGVALAIACAAQTLLVAKYGAATIARKRAVPVGIVSSPPRDVPVAEHVAIERLEEPEPEPPKPAPLPRRAPPPKSFSGDAAKVAVAASLESLPICRRGEVSGRGVAEVVWSPEGHVVRVALSEPFAGTKTGECVVRRLAQATVAPFDGPPAAMRVGFAL